MVIFQSNVKHMKLILMVKLDMVVNKTQKEVKFTNRKRFKKVRKKNY